MGPAPASDTPDKQFTHAWNICRYSVIITCSVRRFRRFIRSPLSECVSTARCHCPAFLYLFRLQARSAFGLVFLSGFSLHRSKLDYGGHVRIHKQSESSNCHPLPLTADANRTRLTLPFHNCCNVALGSPSLLSEARQRRNLVCCSR